MSDHDQTEPPHDILRGEFTVIGNRLHVHQPQATAKHALAVIHQQMVLELSNMTVPRIHVDPEPEEFEDTADYILRVSQVMDRWLKAVGEEVRSNACVRVDLTVFEEQFEGAVQGNATHECDRVAGALHAERAEYGVETDYRRAVSRHGVGA